MKKRELEYQLNDLRKSYDNLFRRVHVMEEQITYIFMTNCLREPLYVESHSGE
jgi:hypothetical protein